MPRREVNEFLERFKVYDGNARKWLNHSNEIGIEKDGSVLLTIPGEEFARAILADIEDPSKEDLWTPAQRASKSRRVKTASRNSDDDGSDAANKSRARININEVAATWKKTHPDFNGHELLQAAPLEELGTFALWTIEMAGEQPDVAVSCSSVARYCLDAFSIKKHTRSIENALHKNAADKKWVVSPGGTTYRLTPGGRKWAAEKAAQHTDIAHRVAV